MGPGLIVFCGIGEGDAGAVSTVPVSAVLHMTAVPLPCTPWRELQNSSRCALGLNLQILHGFTSWNIHWVPSLDRGIFWKWMERGRLLQPCFLLPQTRGCFRSPAEGDVGTRQKCHHLVGTMLTGTGATSPESPQGRVSHRFGAVLHRRIDQAWRTGGCVLRRRLSNASPGSWAPCLARTPCCLSGLLKEINFKSRWFN